MVMYDNEFETKEMKFKPRIKLNHNIPIPCLRLKYPKTILYWMAHSCLGHIRQYMYLKLLFLVCRFKHAILHPQTDYFVPLYKGT